MWDCRRSSPLPRQFCVWTQVSTSPISRTGIAQKPISVKLSFCASTQSMPAVRFGDPQAEEHGFGWTDACLERPFGSSYPETKKVDGTTHRRFLQRAMHNQDAALHGARSTRQTLPPD